MLKAKKINIYSPEGHTNPAGEAFTNECYCFKVTAGLEAHQSSPL
ncbi:hypothetical protein [Pelotomaculum sp. FP]|nr:hypothetical protein [Pelotomaculum sp. FP]